MWDRLLCAIDQFESGQTALAFVAGVASANESSVRLLHLREVPRMARALRLETPIEAKEVVRDDVLTLQSFGVVADGRSCSVQQDNVASRSSVRRCSGSARRSSSDLGVFVGSAGSPVPARGSESLGTRFCRYPSRRQPRAMGSTGLQGSSSPGASCDCTRRVARHGADNRPLRGVGEAMNAAQSRPTGPHFSHTERR